MKSHTKFQIELIVGASDLLFADYEKRNAIWLEHTINISEVTIENISPNLIEYLVAILIFLKLCAP